jgi:DNA-binding GntR family transcriptional regulator
MRIEGGPVNRYLTPMNRIIPPDRQLTRSALSARAYSLLKEMILDQVIAPGARLPIDILAAQIGVSQTPVREALARLEGDGLAARSATGRYHAAPLLDPTTFDQLYATRLLFEPFAAEAAARVIRPEQIKALRALNRRLENAGTEGRSAEFADYVTADTAFHEAIASATGNQFLSDAIHHLHSHHRLGHLYRNRGVTDASHAIREHASIVEALDGRDPHGAAALMREHLCRSRDQLRPWIGQVSRPINNADVRLEERAGVAISS